VEEVPIRQIENDPHFVVIDEADDYIVVDKPAPLLVHPSVPGNPQTLLDGLQGLLAFEIANGATLSIINRLDRETSGIVLVTKNAAAARRYSIAMQQRRVKKEYVALVHGWPGEDAFTVDGPLLRKGEVGESPIWVKQIVHPDGNPSLTHFEVEERFERRGGGRFSRLRAMPVTGRMHQIRVHLAHAGFPVVGDKIYGADETCYLDFIETGWTADLHRRLLTKRHALHSTKLRFEFGDGEVKQWGAPPPPEWEDFRMGS
jgi:23S rRNA pseudouridine1911/1915/1917 synthase